MWLCVWLYLCVCDSKGLCLAQHIWCAFLFSSGMSAVFLYPSDTVWSCSTCWRHFFVKKRHLKSLLGAPVLSCSMLLSVRLKTGSRRSGGELQSCRGDVWRRLLCVWLLFTAGKGLTELLGSSPLNWLSCLVEGRSLAGDACDWAPVGRDCSWNNFSPLPLQLLRRSPLLASYWLRGIGPPLARIWKEFGKKLLSGNKKIK